MLVSAAVRRRKISIFQQFLMSSESSAQQTPRTNRGHRHPDQWRPKIGSSRDKTASDDFSQAPVPAPSNPVDQADRIGGQQPVSSGVQRDVRTAALPDENEQGGKFLQVEGLTTADAEEIPCECSVEDDFMIDDKHSRSQRGNCQGHRGRQEERARRDGSIWNL